MLQFKPLDRVKLTSVAESYYGGVPGRFVPRDQGAGTGGIVLIADENRLHDPRAAARPYFVLWDNGAKNSYREEDLQPEVLIEATIEETEISKVVPFNRF